MNKVARSVPTPILNCPFEYVIQVYSADGQLRSECLLNARKHKIADIEDVEAYVRNTPMIAKFGKSIVVVSSEFADSLDQVHIEIAANDPKCN